MRTGSRLPVDTMNALWGVLDRIWSRLRLKPKTYIVWLEDRANFPFLRESVLWLDSNIEVSADWPELVAYEVVLNRRYPSNRRAWTFRDYDSATGDPPSEAVLVESIKVGKASINLCERHVRRRAKAA